MYLDTQPRTSNAFVDILSELHVGQRVRRSRRKPPISLRVESMMSPEGQKSGASIVPPYCTIPYNAIAIRRHTRRACNPNLDKELLTEVQMGERLEPPVAYSFKSCSAHSYNSLLWTSGRFSIWSAGDTPALSNGEPTRLLSGPIFTCLPCDERRPIPPLVDSPDRRDTSPTAA